MKAQDSKQGSKPGLASEHDCARFKPLLKLARLVVAEKLGLAKIDHEVLQKAKQFSELQGVFVTIHKIVNGKKELRGCIGFVQPVMPLWKATMQAALAAAFQDPRFEPIAKEEFKDLEFEISILSKPELIRASNLEELYNAFHLGSGLIVECFNRSGLLLPQVFIEEKASAEQAFHMVCLKASCPKAWQGFGPSNECLKHARFYSFKAVVCSEQDVLTS